MIPHVTKGRSMRGLIGYLYGAGRHNEHTDQHAVASSGALWIEWGGQLNAEDARNLGKVLESDSRLRTTRERAAARTQAAEQGGAVALLERPEAGPGLADEAWDGVTDEGGIDRPSVFHVSLSISADEGQLDDATWAQIANRFVNEMGFDGDSDRGRNCQWIAVRHGASTAGNDHVHIAVCLVRNDGTWASTHHDFKRAQVAARELEREFGLRQLHPGIPERGMPGYTPGEQRRAAAAGQDVTERTRLGRIVRAVAHRVETEREFVLGLLNEGVRIRPRWADGGRTEVVGYSVKLRDGQLWLGGGKLGSDLTLPRLRERWEATDRQRAEALPVWQGRDRAKGGFVETRRSQATWQSVAADLTVINNRLRAADPSSRSEWAAAAAEGAAVAAELAIRTRGPLSNQCGRLADRLAREAHQAPRVRYRNGSRIVHGVHLLLRSGDKDATRGWYAVLRQLQHMAEAIARAQEARGQLNEVRRLRATVAALPPVTVAPTVAAAMPGRPPAMRARPGRDSIYER